MNAYLPIALVGALLAGAPVLAQQDAPPGMQKRGPPGGPGSDLTDAQAFSAVAGKIVGAAAECDTISKDRVSAATKKAASITSSTATSDDELSTAAALFTDAANAGKVAVRSGRANCQTVELSLSKLEKIGSDEDEDQQ
jgi:hypothetical protein